MFLGLFISSFHHLVTVSTFHNSWCANWPRFTHSSSVSVEALLALKKSPEIFAKYLACYLTVLRITKPTRISLTYLLLHHNIDHVHCPSATLALSCNSRPSWVCNGLREFEIWWCRSSLSTLAFATTMARLRQRLSLFWIRSRLPIFRLLPVPP